MVASVTVVTPTYNREPKFLRNLLHTLDNQTVPVSAIVVDSGESYRDDTRELCEGYDFVKLVEVPRPSFSLSWSCNVGIRTAITDYIMTIGSCVMISVNFIEAVLSKMHEDAIVSGVIGILPESAELGDVVADWDKLCATLDPSLKSGPGGIGWSVGACFVMHREKWHKIHGYNEYLKFAYADSCLLRRARLAGGKLDFIQFCDAQLLHQWHPKSALISQLGGSIAEMQETPMVCNLNGWGEPWAYL